MARRVKGTGKGSNGHKVKGGRRERGNEGGARREVRERTREINGGKRENKMEGRGDAGVRSNNRG